MLGMQPRMTLRLLGNGLSSLAATSSSSSSTAVTVAATLTVSAAASSSRRAFSGKSLKKFKDLDVYQTTPSDLDSSVAKRAGAAQHPNMRAAAQRAREEAEIGDSSLAKLASEKQSPLLYQRMMEMLKPPLPPMEDRRPEDLEADRQFVKHYQAKLQEFRSRQDFFLDRRLQNQRMALNALPRRLRLLALERDKTPYPKEIPRVREFPPWWMAKGQEHDEFAEADEDDV